MILTKRIQNRRFDSDDKKKYTYNISSTASISLPLTTFLSMNDPTPSPLPPARRVVSGNSVISSKLPPSPPHSLVAADANRSLGIRHQQRLSAQARYSYHPAVTSVVHSNTLRDCVQVRDMLSHCVGHHTEDENDSFVCRTAQRYNDFCVQDPGKE